MRFLARKNRKPPIVIIVALIDVLMVVLIFMVVTTTFTNQAAVKLALPESSQARATPAVSNDLIVTVARKPPYIYLGDEIVDPGALEAGLKKAIDANPELELSIRADTDAPFGQIIKVMDAAKAVGITSVKAFTKEPDGG